MAVEHYSRLLRHVYGDRRWVVAMDALAGARGVVDALHRAGADSCLCIAAFRGAGPLPDASVAPDPVVLGIKSGDMMSGIRASLDAFANLPESAVARVDAFDPSGTARAIGSIFDDGRDTAGRRKFGRRPQSWQALEDKTLIESVWDAAGIARADSEVTSVDANSLDAATRRLDRGDGCVWAGDNREGFHGGASYLRWVRSHADLEEAVRFFGGRCASVRVMPFLEGIPCSIHAMVLPEKTVAFRPCELLVFRCSQSSRLHYGRAATFWDPPAAVREAMRGIARCVGEHLRKQVGYRGALTVDGVLTADGFLPTELNPRYGAAMDLLARPLTELSLLLLNLAIVEDEPLDWQANELERLVVASSDAQRAGGGLALVHKPVEADQSMELAIDQKGDVQQARKGETADAIATLGPAATGGFLRVELAVERTPIGPSVAGRVGKMLRFADIHWDLGIGELEPAREVRT